MVRVRFKGIAGAAARPVEEVGRCRLRSRG